MAIPVAYHHLLGSIKPPKPLSPETKKVNAITVTESASKQLIRTCLAPKEEQKGVYIYVYYIYLFLFIYYINSGKSWWQNYASLQVIVETK